MLCIQQCPIYYSYLTIETVTKTIMHYINFFQWTERLQTSKKSHALSFPSNTNTIHFFGNSNIDDTLNIIIH